MTAKLLRNISKFRFKNKEDRQLADRLRLILGFYPENIALYHQAFRHSSVSQVIKEGFKNSNERLEYLGDAVLGAIIAEYLFQLYPFKDEGFLTQLRSRIVNRNQLNQLALKLGLNEVLEADTKGMIKSASLYGDAFEAFIGAIYLDKGYAKTRRFVLDRILKIHLNIAELEQNDTDFKSKLINLCQKEKWKINFNLVEETGKGHEKEYTVQVEINGEPMMSFQHSSKRRAEQLAAQLTLEKLEAK